MAQAAARPDQLEVHLLATARAIRRAYDVRLADLDLQMTESGILQILAIEGALSQTALAARLHIGRSAAGSFVEGLATRGLVERRRDPGDGRIWLITNTEAGTTMARSCVDVNKAILADLRAGLTRAEQQQLFTLLDRVRTNAHGLSTD